MVLSSIYETQQQLLRGKGIVSERVSHPPLDGGLFFREKSERIIYIREIMLHTYIIINRHAGTQDKNKSKAIVSSTGSTYLNNSIIILPSLSYNERAYTSILEHRQR